MLSMKYIKNNTYHKLPFTWPKTFLTSYSCVCVFFQFEV